MAYDTFNYDIKSRLPLWWQEDTFLEPINRYSQEILKDIVGGFLATLGIMQPFQVWKTLPTEYSWIHTYIEHDELLRTKEGGTTSKYLKANKPIIAEIPSSKRNCHGVIQLNLRGNYKEGESPVGKITIKNAHQQITINNITTMTDIKIYTEDQMILIDGVQRSDLVTGSFDKIYSQAKNNNFNDLDIDDENKITYIEIESDSDVYFDLKIKHIHPVYVTEQNIRAFTVSAFPLEYIKLYGFYCNEFNNKQEWRFLWEKNYDIEDRVVFDRITKQFNCETFYIQVKLHGIGIPLVYGFPQEEFNSNPAFNINTILDKWGRILGLPRRYYKNYISDDEERYTFPPFYKYHIEQDYWYERRLLNEYKYNDDAINGAFIKDDELNNIALLKCIDPFIEDIYVYTETIAPGIDYNHEIGYINPTYLNQGDEGVPWNNSQQISNTTYAGVELTLNPKINQYINDKTYQTTLLEVNFEDIPELPKNINITGIELKLYGLTDIHSDALQLDERSSFLLPIFDTSTGDIIERFDVIPIALEDNYWQKGKGSYSIGGKNNLFGLEKIERSQIQNGLTFNIGLTNTSEFLKATIMLYNIQLFIYYQIIYDKYNINIEFNSKSIVINDPEKQEINMYIHLKNTGEIPAVNKNIYIATPPELNITNNKFPTFDLDVKEEFTIGNEEYDKITITCPNNIPGLYDIIVFCDDYVIKNEITVKEVNINDIK